MTLLLDSENRRLADADGRVFDPVGRRWSDSGSAMRGTTVSLAEALIAVQGWPNRCRVPVGVIGGREARPDQLAAAESMGRVLAEAGMTVVCGGRQGIMEATCRGVAGAGGISVGILPDGSPESANPHVTVPIATGIGIARNAIVARAALCLIAIGGGYGTISEAAFALQFERPVFSLLDGPAIAGIHACDSVDQVLDGVARVVLGLPLDRPV